MEKRRASKKTVSKKAASKSTASPEPAAVPIAAAGPPPLPSNVLPLFPGFVPDYEWVLGLVVVAGPERKTQGRRKAQTSAQPPVAALFLEAGSGVVLHVDLLPSMTPRSVGATLRRALERCEALGLHKPTRIRIGAPAQVELLGEAARHGIEVVVGPAPEVDEVLRSPGAIRGFAPAPVQDVDVYRGEAPISDERLHAFFAAADGFRRGKPWRVLDGISPLLLRIPALGLEEGGVTLLGNEGRGGLLAFLELDAMLRAYETGDLSLPAGNLQQCLAVGFVPASGLSRARRRELQAMAFAPPRGPFPVLIATDDDGQPRALEDTDYALAIAALEATGRFVREFGSLAHHPSLQALMARYDQVDIGFPEGSRSDDLLGDNWPGRFGRGGSGPRSGGGSGQGGSGPGRSGPR